MFSAFTNSLKIPELRSRIFYTLALLFVARVGAHISVIGILTGLGGEVSVVTALIKQLRMQGLIVGNRSQQQDMVKAMDANGMRPIVDKVFPLENIVEAFKYQESNKHFGKICLEM